MLVCLVKLNFDKMQLYELHTALCVHKELMLFNQLKLINIFRLQECILELSKEHIPKREHFLLLQNPHMMLNMIHDY